MSRSKRFKGTRRPTPTMTGWSRTRRPAGSRIGFGATTARPPARPRQSSDHLIALDHDVPCERVGEPTQKPPGGRQRLSLRVAALGDQHRHAQTPRRQNRQDIGGRQERQYDVGPAGAHRPAQSCQAPRIVAQRTQHIGRGRLQIERLLRHHRMQREIGRPAAPDADQGNRPATRRPCVGKGDQHLLGATDAQMRDYQRKTQIRGGSRGGCGARFGHVVPDGGEQHLGAAASVPATRAAGGDGLFDQAGPLRHDRGLGDIAGHSSPQHCPAGAAGRDRASGAPSAAAIAATSPGGTSSPSKPEAIIARGPPTGQSVAITGMPAAIASISALGKPSWRELKTKIVVLASQLPGVALRPGHSTRLPTPCRSASASRSPRPGPSPQSTSRQSAWAGCNARKRLDQQVESLDRNQMANADELAPVMIR